MDGRFVAALWADRGVRAAGSAGPVAHQDLARPGIDEVAALFPSTRLPSQEVPWWTVVSCEQLQLFAGSQLMWSHPLHLLPVDWLTAAQRAGELVLVDAGGVDVPTAVERLDEFLVRGDVRRVNVPLRAGAPAPRSLPEYVGELHHTWAAALRSPLPQVPHAAEMPAEPTLSWLYAAGLGDPLLGAKVVGSYETPDGVLHETRTCNDTPGVRRDVTRSELWASACPACAQHPDRPISSYPPNELSLRQTFRICEVLNTQRVLATPPTAAGYYAALDTAACAAAHLAREYRRDRDSFAAEVAVVCAATLLRAAHAGSDLAWRTTSSLAAERCCVLAADDVWRDSIRNQLRERLGAVEAHVTAALLRGADPFDGLEYAAQSAGVDHGLCASTVSALLETLDGHARRLVGPLHLVACAAPYGWPEWPPARLAALRWGWAGTEVNAAVVVAVPQPVAAILVSRGHETAADLGPMWPGEDLTAVAEALAGLDRSTTTLRLQRQLTETRARRGLASPTEPLGYRPLNAAEVGVRV